MEEALARHGGAAFVCGIVRNLDQLLDLFDGVFLLQIDERTQDDRLAAHDTVHPPGRSEAGRQEIWEGRAVFQAQMLKLGATAFDGTTPTASLADQLLALVAAT